MLVNLRLLIFCILSCISVFSSGQRKTPLSDTLYYSNGNISAIGTYDKNGLGTGGWEFYAPNQFVCWKGNLLPVKSTQPICTPDSNTCLDLTAYGVTGTPDGLWVALGPKGQISQQLILKNGRPDGDWLVYNYLPAQPVLWEKSTWVNGAVREHFIFDPSNADTTKIIYFQGDTTIHMDYENRILQSRKVVLPGKRSETTTYHPNGKIGQVRIHDDVLQQATTYDYDEEGKLIRMQILDLLSWEMIKDETYE